LRGTTRPWVGIRVILTANVVGRRPSRTLHAQRHERAIRVCGVGCWCAACETLPHFARTRGVGPLWVLSEVTKGQEGLRDVLHGEETAGVGMAQGPVTPEVTSPW
jgi:hypothetical protein